MLAGVRGRRGLCAPSDTQAARRTPAWPMPAG